MNFNYLWETFCYIAFEVFLLLYWHLLFSCARALVNLFWWNKGNEILIILKIKKNLLTEILLGTLLKTIKNFDFPPLAHPCCFRVTKKKLNFSFSFHSCALQRNKNVSERNITIEKIQRYNLKFRKSLCDAIFYPTYIFFGYRQQKLKIFPQIDWIIIFSHSLRRLQKIEGKTESGGN